MHTSTEARRSALCHNDLAFIVGRATASPYPRFRTGGSPKVDILAGSDVRARLDGNPAALRALREREATGGEPDVVSLGGDADALTFCDCAAESPLSRRSCCFDEVGE
jgi:hypothetical protein